MDKLPTLMASGDMDVTDADNTLQQHQQPRQSTAGNSASCTQYRMAHDDDDDIESEEDEERPSAHYTVSTDMDQLPANLEMSCSGGTGTIDERHQGEESDTDGAGHCSGELRCDPSVLESWTFTVHQHRTGLAGNGRASTGSSGRGSGPDVDEGDRLQLAKIMSVADRTARFRAIRRFLDEFETANGNGVANESQPSDPRLATVLLRGTIK